MKITEIIADTIQQLLNEQGGTIQIQRNDLANQIGCVPSQINYVITSRFTREQGYIVESRRGGGGFVKIIRVNHSKNSLIMHIINSISDYIDEGTARNIIKDLYQTDNINLYQAKLMLSVIQDNNFKGLPDEIKLALRCNLLKTMLINCIIDN
ncbi:MAG: CtsR family transcriptional regulator [Oscillospiraceae bacterium]